VSWTIRLLFVFALYFAFKYTRYKMAGMLAVELGGSVVFKIGGSYMKAHSFRPEGEGLDCTGDGMIWGNILSVLTPSGGVFFLRRDANLGFRFLVEAKSGPLFRTVYPNGLKDTEFNESHLDKYLKLMTNNLDRAVSCFSAPESQQALLALLDAGFTEPKGDHGAIVAKMKGIPAEDVTLKKLTPALDTCLFFKRLNLSTIQIRTEEPYGKEGPQNNPGRDFIGIHGCAATVGYRTKQ
jgi:hypothetical protein